MEEEECNTALEFENCNCTSVCPRVAHLPVLDLSIYLQLTLRWCSSTRPIHIHVVLIHIDNLSKTLFENTVQLLVIYEK